MKGDYARAHAAIIGMAASMHLITTQVSAGKFGNSWRITIKGQSWRNEQDTE